MFRRCARLLVSQADVASALEKHFGDALLKHKISGEVNSCSFTVEVVASSFQGLSRLQRQRSVYAALAPIMSQIHSVSMQTLTPGEAGLLEPASYTPPTPGPAVPPDSVSSTIAAASASSVETIPAWVSDIDADIPLSSRTIENESIRIYGDVGLQNVNVFGPPSFFDLHVAYTTLRPGFGARTAEEGCILSYHLIIYRRRPDGSLEELSNSRTHGRGEAISHVQSSRKLVGMPRGIDELFLRMMPGQIVRAVIDPAWGYKTPVHGLDTTQPLICDVELLTAS